MQWLEEDYVESCDFDVIGIGCAAGPHRLCWELNARFHWELSFHHTMNRPQRQGNSKHLVYKGRGVMLILNRHPEGVLVKTTGVNRLDYLLRLAHSENPDEQIDSVRILPEIRKMNLVMLATQIDPATEGVLEHLALLDCAEAEVEED